MITGPTGKLNAGTIAWINHQKGAPFHVAISTVGGAGLFRVVMPAPFCDFPRLLWVRKGWLPKDPFNWFNKMAVMVIAKDQNEQISVLHGAN